jgi:nicotinamidase-related amidase
MQKEWKDTPALLLIDIQKGMDELDFYGGERNNPDAESNAALILDYWRQNNWPLFHIKHCSVTPGSPLTEGLPGNDFKKEVKPRDGEPVITKQVNSAFIGTDLKQQLDARNIRTLVIVGLTTEHCVSTTTRMAANFGFRTIVVPDATASFRSKGLNGQPIPAQTVYEISLATLYREFAVMVPTREVLKSRLAPQPSVA